MQEQAIQWGAISLFGSVVLGFLLINLGMRWREKQRRRYARGFRNMKSTAQQQRERTRRSEWQQAPRSSQRGWR